MEDARKILITPWGDYSRWSKVIYRFPDEDNGLNSKTTLFFLLDHIEPDQAFVLLPDTLLAADALTEGYIAIQETIKLKALEFIQNEETADLEDKRREALDKKIELLVIPGSGRFPNGRFIGKLTDYFYFSYLEMVDRVLKTLEKEDYGRVEFHLDLSHGINYMPSLIYRLVREIAALVATKYDVRFVAYNSEPFIGQGKKELTVHAVECVDVDPFVPKVAFPEAVNNLEEIIGFLTSAKHGFPLLFCNLFPTKQTIEHLIQGLRTDFVHGIQISEDGERKLERNVPLDEKSRILGLAKVLTFFFGSFVQNDCDDCGGVKLKDLKNFVDTVSLFTDIHKELIIREFDTISTKVGELQKSTERISGEWFSYSKVYGEDNPKNHIDRRNFFAHAGLERNCLEVFFHEGNGRISSRLCLRYHDLDAVLREILDT